MDNSLLDDCLHFSATIAWRYYKTYRTLFTLFSISFEDLMQEAKVEALKEYRKWEVNPIFNLKAHLSMCVGWKRMNSIRRQLLEKIYVTGIVKGKNFEEIMKNLRKFSPDDIQCLSIKNNYNTDNYDENGEIETNEIEVDEDDPEIPNQEESILLNNRELYDEVYYKNLHNKELYQILGEMDYEELLKYIRQKFKNKLYYQVLEMRIIKGCTFEEVGQKLKVSRQRIEQITKILYLAIQRYNTLLDK